MKIIANDQTIIGRRWLSYKIGKTDCEHVLAVEHPRKVESLKENIILAVLLLVYKQY
jgi:hypothetical protein